MFRCSSLVRVVCACRHQRQHDAAADRPTGALARAATRWMAGAGWWVDVCGWRSHLALVPPEAAAACGNSAGMRSGRVRARPAHRLWVEHSRDRGNLRAAARLQPLAKVRSFGLLWRARGASLPYRRQAYARARQPTAQERVRALARHLHLRSLTPLRCAIRSRVGVARGLVSLARALHLTLGSWNAPRLLPVRHGSSHLGRW